MIAVLEAVVVVAAVHNETVMWAAAGGQSLTVGVALTVDRGKHSVAPLGMAYAHCPDVPASHCGQLITDPAAGSVSGSGEVEETAPGVVAVVVVTVLVVDVTVLGESVGSGDGAPVLGASVH